MYKPDHTPTVPSQMLCLLTHPGISNTTNGRYSNRDTTAPDTSKSAANDILKIDIPSKRALLTGEERQ